MERESIFDKSTPQKLQYTGYALLRYDGYYTTFDPISIVNSAVAFSVVYGTESFDLSLKQLKKYLKCRKIFVDENTKLIDEKESCYGGDEGIMFVSSTSKKEIMYSVKIYGLINSGMDEKNKLDSLRKLRVDCGCKRSNYQTITRTSIQQRKLVKDERRWDDKKQPPYGDSVIDRHAGIALNYLSIMEGLEGFELFDLSKHVTDLTRKVVKMQLNHRVRIQDYVLNLLLRDMTNLFEPIRQRVKIF
jgi:hypothetical protein